MQKITEGDKKEVRSILQLLLNDVDVSVDKHGTISDGTVDLIVGDQKCKVYVEENAIMISRKTETEQDDYNIWDLDQSKSKIITEIKSFLFEN